MHADVAARQVAHAERPHREAEGLDRGIHLLRARAFVDHGERLHEVLVDHAVADEAVAHAGYHGGLADLLRQRHGRGEHVRRRLRATHHFEQAHDVRRAEEMQSDDVLRALREGGDPVHVQRRGVGGEDRTGLHRRIELAEDFFLDAHFLEHGFDDQIVAGDTVVGQGRMQQRHARRALGGIELALADLALVHVAYARHAALERFLAEFEQVHRDSRVEEVDRDAGAHGAGADDRHGADVAHRGARGQAVDARRGALGEEDMPQRERDRRIEQRPEQPGFLGVARVEGQLRGSLHGVDDGQRCGVFLERRTGGVARELQQRLEVGLHDPAVAHARQRLAGGACRGGGLGNLEGSRQQVRFDEPVEQRRPGEQRCRHGLAAQHHVEGALDTDQPRQALRAPRSRHQAELDLGQADAGALERHAVMAGQRQLEAAAEGDPLDGRHHGLGGVVEQRVDAPDRRAPEHL